MVAPRSRILRISALASLISPGVRPDSTSSSSTSRGRDASARQFQELALVQIQVVGQVMRLGLQPGKFQPLPGFLHGLRAGKRRAAEHRDESKNAREIMKDLIYKTVHACSNDKRGLRSNSLLSSP